jgi:putative ABC transport system permease protein
MLQTLSSDLNAALRRTVRRPVPALAVAATLAVFIGAATTAFGLARAVLWRALPFADDGRLVFVWEDVERDGGMQAVRVTASRYATWRDHATAAFSSIAVFGAAGFTLDTSAGAVSVHGVRVSAGYFSTLGVAAALGRTFTPSDEVPGLNNVVVLSNAFWIARLGGSPDVVGTTLHLSGRPYTIIGVMPPGVYPGWPVNPAVVTVDPDDRQLWVPIPRTPQFDQSNRAHVLGVVARLAPGVSEAQALDILNASNDPSAPDPHAGRLTPLREQFVRDARAPLLALAGAALAILLIACGNLASVFVSGFEARRAEFAVRAAIGAGVSRLVRQVTIEALIPALAGGLAGIALARFGLAAVPSQLPPTVPFLTTPQVDLSAAAVAITLAVIAALVITLWPIRRLVTLAPAPRGVPERPRGVIYRLLVVSQIAMAVALIAAAGLLSRSLQSVRSEDPGFDIDNVLVATISLPAPAAQDPGRIAATERDLLSRVLALPGVRSAAVAYDHPLQANWSEAPVVSGDTTTAESRQQSELRIVSPGYFEALDVDLLEGRRLAEEDDLSRPGAAVVNEAFARALGGRVIGRRIQANAPQFTYPQAAPADFAIVGVVENERFRGLEIPAQPAFYLSTRQFPQTGVDLLVRTSGDPLTRAADIRTAVAALDRAITFSQPTTLRRILADQLAARRVTTSVIGTFAGAALVLAALGLYGLLAILVATRTREIGVRLALGAPPRAVARAVLRESLQNAAAGVAIGCVLALLAGRLIQGLLVGVSPADPFTLGTVALTLMIVAGAAALLPALRAARVDPIQALRAE